MKYLTLVLAVAGSLSIFGCDSKKTGSEGGNEKDTFATNENPADKDTVTVKLDSVVEDTTVK